MVATLPADFYDNALEKVVPFSEKQSLTARQVLKDLGVSARGRQTRLESGGEPDWGSLKIKIGNLVDGMTDQEVRDMLKEKFELNTQSQILKAFGEIREQKQQNSADFPTGGYTSNEVDEDFDEDEDFE